MQGVHRGYHEAIVKCTREDINTHTHTKTGRERERAGRALGTGNETTSHANGFYCPFIETR